MRQKFLRWYRKPFDMPEWKRLAIIIPLLFIGALLGSLLARVITH